jgi:hypothetical protein
MSRNRKWTVWMMGILAALTLAMALPTVALAAGGPPPNRSPRRNQGDGLGDGSGLPPAAGELDEASQEALIEAINEEYGALATYEAVMDQFGTVQPFASVARSEERHVAALVTLFERYGLDVPAAPELDVPEFDTLQDACEAGVQAEIADAALYDQLFEVVTAPDIVQVFTNLQNASLNNHLPAFEACVEGNTVNDADARTGYGARTFGRSMWSR